MSKETNSLMRKESSKGFPIVLTAVIIILAIGAGGFLLFQDTEAPTITIGPDLVDVGKNTQLTISVADLGSGLKNLDIIAIQGDKQIPLVSRTFPDGVMQAEEIIELNKGTIKEGEFSIMVTTRDADRKSVV